MNIVIQNIYDSIALCGFSVNTLKLIDNYITDIQNGTENFPRFTLSEYAGFCTAGAPIIGATFIANYTRASLEAGSNASGCQGSQCNCFIFNHSNWLIECIKNNKRSNYRYFPQIHIP